MLFIFYDEMFASPGYKDITLWDSLEECFLKEVSQLEGKLLDEDNLTLVRVYSLKINHGLTNDAYNSLCFLFPYCSVTMTQANVFS